MNRRSFITKTLAGIAAVPLLGRLVNASESQTYDVAFGPIDEVTEVCVDGKRVYPSHYIGLIEHSEEGLREVKAKGYRRMPFREGAPVNFPIAEEDWGYVTHVALAEHPTGPISQLFDVHHWCRRTIRTGQATRLDLEIISSASS
jgi:hypothetical protein